MLSRRHVLQLLAVGGAGALAGPASSGAAPWTGSTHRRLQGAPEPGEGETFDVVVVGGGVSGVYVAWRLKTADPGRTIAVCEMSERIGGRLYSVTPPEMPHVRAEVGGMRFHSRHVLVSRLIEHLGLTVDRFLSGDPRNLLYLRGRQFTQADWHDPNRVPYLLRDDGPIKEVGKSPLALQRAVIERVAPDAAEFSPRDWDAFKQTATVAIDDTSVSLYDVGFWNLLQGSLSNEGFELVHDAAYPNFRSDWNAAEAFSWLWADVVAGTLHRVRDGFQALPLELARRFQDAGGDVLQPYRLRTLNRAQDGRMRLVFERGVDRQEWTCSAEHVVLALPRRSLQLLDQRAFLFENQQLRADLDGLVPQVAMKAFLGYAEPWWTDSLGLQSGPSVTDLPMRQCLYFETEGDQPSADPDNRNALLLASYDAGNGIEFWRGLPDRPLFPAMATHVAGAAHADASHLLVDELQRELQLLHGSEVQVPDPYAALFMDWGQDPFGAGWHFWPIGVKSWEVMPRIRQPVADANVYVCGEAWSTTQGWVEGALQTAEQVLRQKFGLPGPSWLPPDAHLGP